MSEVASEDAERRAWPPVDVVVLGWKNGDKTIANLRSLAGCGYPNLRVVVIDNGSDEGSDDVVWDELRRLHPGALRIDYTDDWVSPDRLHRLYEEAAEHSSDLRCASEAPAFFVRSLHNRGYAGGMNLGLHVTRRVRPGKYFWLLANDIIVAPGAIEALVRRCEEDDRIGLCGATQHVLRPDGSVMQRIPGAFVYSRVLGWGLPAHRLRSTSADRSRVEKLMSGVQGSAVFGSYGLIESVGMLSTDRFLYFEEPEWGLRAKRAGFKVAWAPDAIVSNQHTGTMMVAGKKPTERLAAVHYLMARGGVLFTRRYHPYFLPTVVAARLLRSAEDAVRKGPRVGWSSLLGIVDGFTGHHRSFPLLGDALLPGQARPDAESELDR